MSLDIRRPRTARRRYRVLIGLCVEAAFVGCMLLFLSSLRGFLSSSWSMLSSILIGLVGGGVLLKFLFGLYDQLQSRDEERPTLIQRRYRNAIIVPRALSEAIHEGSLCSDSEASEIESLLNQAEGFQGYRVRCLEEGEDKEPWLYTGPAVSLIRIGYALSRRSCRVSCRTPIC